MSEQEDRRQQKIKDELAEVEAKRNRAQVEIDRWWQGLRDEEEYQRRLRRELDPFNWGHWN
jgi:hypothetical protein